VSQSAERIDILWLIKGLGLGGAEQLLAAHAALADHDRFRYRAAYVVPGKDAMVPQLEQAGVEVSRLGSEGRSWLTDLARAVRTVQPNVMHVHSPLVAAAARLVVRSLPRGRRPRLVYTEHNRWPMYRRPTRLANRLTYRLDDVKLAVSADVVASVPERMRDRIEVLIHGIDTEAVGRFLAERDDARAELGVADDDVLVGTIANLRPEKGYPDLLKAAARVIHARGDVRFMSVGTGPQMEAAVELHGQLGLGDRFRFLGLREDARRLMAGFDVFCLASLHEGLPVTVMEAMALGRPTVATRAGGIPEAIRDGLEGLLVEPGQPEQLAAALTRMAAEPDLRATMGRAARDRAPMFDAARAVRHIEELYVQVARDAVDAIGG
jgi:glycosyltransferase involved in cell wall biosynthesis